MNVPADMILFVCLCSQMPCRVSFVGCFLASALTGKGPITLLVEHLADPTHSTIIQILQ